MPLRFSAAEGPKQRRGDEGRRAGWRLASAAFAPKPAVAHQLTPFSTKSIQGRSATTMKIRSIHPSDVASIHALNQSAVPHVGAMTPDELSHIIDESCISLVAHPASLSEQVVGFCLVLAPTADYSSQNFRWFCDRYNDFIYLDRVAVDQNYRRQGIGARFYETIGRLAPTRCPEARWLTLEVNIEPRNEASLAFHEGMGFEIVGERDTRYGTKVALMQKNLEARG